MIEIWEDEQLLVNKQVQSRHFVALHAGATQRIMEYINQNLKKKHCALKTRIPTVKCSPMRDYKKKLPNPKEFI